MHHIDVFQECFCYKKNPQREVSAVLQSLRNHDIRNGCDCLPKKKEEGQEEHWNVLFVSLLLFDISLDREGGNQLDKVH